MTVRRSIEVRYSDCDMQRVVHNANYLKWCDDASDLLFRDAGADLEGGSWDVMVKTATLTWTAPARLRDVIDIDLGVSRWGTTSFDVTFRGSRAGEAVFEAVITYVAVRADALDQTVPVPEEFRRAAVEL